MAVDGTTPTGGSLSGLSGTDYAAAVNEEVAGNHGRSTFAITSVAGTNTITGTVSAITALAAGMSFWLVPAVTNAGAVTLNINSYGAVDVVDNGGNALESGHLVASSVYKLYYDGTEYKVTSPDIDRLSPNYQVFTSSGTWTKPAGCPDDALVIVEMWGAGGGGGSGSERAGGGGGGYRKVGLFRAGDLGSTETVTIGGGGTVGVAGGNSTFGSLLTAHGGGFGRPLSGTLGGGGGGGAGALGKGGDATGTGSGSAGAGGKMGGGGGGDGADNANDFGSPGSDAALENAGAGGGGGGGDNNQAGGDGGDSGYGGAGGGGLGDTGDPAGTGGSSALPNTEGDGGDGGVAGTPPGGGGGGGAAGARGECRVWTVM